MHQNFISVLHKYFTNVTYNTTTKITVQNRLCNTTFHFQAIHRTNNLCTVLIPRCTRKEEESSIHEFVFNFFHNVNSKRSTNGKRLSKTREYSISIFKCSIHTNLLLPALPNLRQNSNNCMMRCGVGEWNP